MSRRCSGLYSMGVVTNRDEWVYDFDVATTSGAKFALSSMNTRKADT